jgi:hypothetical protein
MQIMAFAESIAVPTISVLHFQPRRLLAAMQSKITNVLSVKCFQASTVTVYQTDGVAQRCISDRI